MPQFKYSPENAQMGFGTKSLRMQELLSPYLRKANACGFNFIDCAWRYGNEAIIGLALKDIKKSDMAFEINLAFQSKVWPSQFSGGIAKSLKFTLQKIGAISMIDSYMLHRPHPLLEINVSAWKQLLDCRRNRLTRKIGLGHFDKDLIEFLFKTTNSYPDFVQFEISINNMRHDRIAYAKSKNIKIQAIEPFGNYEANIKNPLLIKMAEKYKTSVKNILLAFLLNQDIIPIVVPASLDEIDDLILSKNIVLSQADLDSLMTVNTYDARQFEGVEIDLK